MIQSRCLPLCWILIQWKVLIIIFGGSERLSVARALGGAPSELCRARTAGAGRWCFGV